MAELSFEEIGMPESTILLAIKEFVKRHNYAPSRTELALFIASEEFAEVISKMGVVCRNVKKNPNALKSWIYYYTKETAKERSILVACGVIYVDKSKRPERLYLTKLGKWISEGNLSDIRIKIDFCFNMVCKRCSHGDRIVLMTPIIKSAWTSTKGKLHVDVSCPVCGAQGHCVIKMRKTQFLELYDRVAAELCCYFGQVLRGKQSSRN